MKISLSDLDSLTTTSTEPTPLMNATELIAAIKEEALPERAPLVARFFQAFPGGYAEGDVFWGMRVPTLRTIARRGRSLPLEEVATLLTYPVHEVRLTGSFIIGDQMTAALKAEKKRKPTNANSRNSTTATQLFSLYLTHRAGINNWDIVDSSAPHVIGAYLYEIESSERESALLETLMPLALSNSLWERRIALIAPFYFIRRGRYETALTLISLTLERHQQEPLHHLLEKAAGWMLREIGERRHDLLIEYLTLNNHRMPSIMRSYSLEKCTPEEKKRFRASKESVY